MLEIEIIKPPKLQSVALKLRDLNRGDFFKFKDVQLISRFSKEEIICLVSKDSFINLRNCFIYSKDDYKDDNVVKCELLEPILIKELNC